ncbi:hypothetical protein VE01_09957 [Pseudogymnoascus verrucosus]|uniref:Uncharacterized protein n=1 Tax=Pseudogymnoascus verrucosus TaxID=342668 RepID=A0A1B8G849_9PEZI|nr:uncharacterized protein VE01_09957 [Pseudogymnoascus verrucosus]OBT92003.1 hypothetical protein VE01_09957 [Pseudogymnoascus verrucosus]
MVVLEMEVGERAVETTTDSNQVGNVERADQRGYVTPRLWTDSMFLPQISMLDLEGRTQDSQQSAKNDQPLKRMMEDQNIYISTIAGDYNYM